MNRFDKKTVEEKLLDLRKENDQTLPWFNGIFIKSLILLPLILFLIGLFIFNRPENIYQFIEIIFLPIGLIFMGVALLYLMENI